jgi:hypothetical protein
VRLVTRNYHKGATETDAPITYTFFFHVLIWTMRGPPIVYHVLTNVTVRSYDWA